MKKACWLLALVAAVMLSAGPVLADGDFYVIGGGGGVGTKITSLPFPINAAGFYYVTGNLTCASGNGITVNVDDVTIDLMGFCLSGNSSIKGIYMNGRKNVEIRNGTLSGWQFGIHEMESNAMGHRILNIRAQANTYGIYLNGQGHLVKGCTARDNSDYGIVAYNSTISNNLAYISQGLSGNYGIEGSGIISGNVVSSYGTGINCVGPGTTIGNTVVCNNGQTGIKVSTSVSNYILLDQNAVSGSGTRYTGGSVAATVWAGSNTATASQWGNNAGHQ